MRRSLAPILLALLLLPAGCSSDARPPYDAAVGDALDHVSIDTMTLFAALSTGAEATSFPTREDRYNRLIGQAEALALRAGARPMPERGVSDAIDWVLDRDDDTKAQSGTKGPPSAHALNKVAEALTRLRELDRRQGVTSAQVRDIKAEITVYLDQAMAYENDLRR